MSMIWKFRGSPGSNLVDESRDLFISRLGLDLINLTL